MGKAESANGFPPQADQVSGFSEYRILWARILDNILKRYVGDWINVEKT
jgi:hypothetical protein